MFIFSKLYMNIQDLLSNDDFSNKKVLLKLMCFVLDTSKEHIMSHMEESVDGQDLEKIRGYYIEYNENKRPLEYIMGYVEIGDVRVKVNENVLIPRPETEYMIESAVEFLDGKKDFVITDIGTGSGIIGVWVASKIGIEWNKWIFTDISEGALWVAKMNFSEIIGDSRDVKFQIANLADFLLDTNEFTGSENICILANLPYIPDETFENETSDHVKKWEPALAFLGGDDGLDLYRIMLEQLKKFPWDNITAFFEMMGWQMDVLIKEFPEWSWEVVDTFHFNIKIVKAIKN